MITKVSEYLGRKRQERAALKNYHTIARITDERVQQELFAVRTQIR